MRTLELREVVKHYASPGGEPVRAVDGVSLTVRPGEFVALYGPSGSGKTTLLTIAAGMTAPDSGRVVFERRNVSELDERDGASFRLRDLGFIFQAFHLVAGASALDNASVKLVGAGLSPSAARERAREWLDRVGLAERAAHTPDKLSAGECQRVALARALANDPKLILADEPTGNLDTQRGREVLTLLRELSRERGLPIVLVTHDPQAVEFVDRIHTLRDGRLVDGLDSPVIGMTTGQM